MNSNYEVSLVPEKDLASGTLFPVGKRFAIAVPAGKVTVESCSGASSLFRYPAEEAALLDPPAALGFLTWVRFAGRHYGRVFCIGTQVSLPLLAGLLSRWTPTVQLPVDGPVPAAGTEQLAAVLTPLVGTQYTAIEEFRLLIAELRQKCPWDHLQTHSSLLETLLEESYEVALAIEKNSAANLQEELGDLLLQIFMQSEIARGEGLFDIVDVINGIDEKLTFRHPHVFGDATVTSSDQVLQNWQKLKLMEGRKKHFIDSAKLLSSMENALLAQETARADGFDFESVEQAYDKLLEESGELGNELHSCAQDPENVSMELGDVLFSALNIARLAGINPVKALRHSLAKFRDRYQRVRAYAAEDHVDIATAPAEELDKLWQRAKSQ